MSFLCRGHAAVSRVTPTLCRGHAATSRVPPSLCRGHATVSRRRNSVILAQGPCDSVQRKIRHQARHKVRTSGPALEGSIVSPLVNTMGGLSGGRRDGDVSGAASAPSRRAAIPSFGLGFGLWKPLPSLCHQEGIRQRRLQHTPTQELSHVLTVLLHSAC